MRRQPCSNQCVPCFERRQRRKAHPLERARSCSGFAAAVNARHSIVCAALSAVADGHSIVESAAKDCLQLIHTAKVVVKHRQDVDELLWGLKGGRAIGGYSDSDRDHGTGQSSLCASCAHQQRHRDAPLPDETTPPGFVHMISVELSHYFALSSCIFLIGSCLTGKVNSLLD